MRAGFIALVATIVVSSVGLAAASGAEPGAAAQPAADLPPGPGHDITVQACLGCHAADVITRRHLSPADWKDMVDVMVNYGAAADDQQKAEITAYLTRVLPPLPATSDNGAPSAPTAPAK